MRITCQFTIYPLGVENLAPPVEAALMAVRKHRLEPKVGAMSSTVSGELETVMAALGDAFKAAARGDCVMVVSVSNAC